jgi:hypothetical protein
MWNLGQDTLAIANFLGIGEPQVYQKVETIRKYAARLKR